ncbi:MAG: DEAD/DEAH box helicase [Candidatus Woesearchaeota archaeon]
MSQPLKPRLYQEIITAKASVANTLVVLPTGLGKTMISAMLAKHRLHKFPDMKILILAPTRPLVNQHKVSFESFLDEPMCVFTGQTKPEKRKEQFANNTIIFSTPQGLENDVLSSRIHMEEISLLIVDEAHRAVGEYSYVWLAKQYQKQSKNPLVLGLTASPGSDKETIQEVIDNLHIEQIEYRTKDSPDVAPYVQETDVSYIDVELPDSFRDILRALERAYTRRIQQIQQMGYLKSKRPMSIIKTELLKFTGSLQMHVKKNPSDVSLYSLLSLTAQALKLSHALDLVQTQGLLGARIYFETMFSQSKKTKAIESLMQDADVRFAYMKIDELVQKDVTHPKLTRLFDLVQETLKKDGAKVIVFSQYRETLKMMQELFSSIPAIRAAVFVGQAKKNGSGLSQKEQIRLLEQFRDGEFNVLCMSSVGEEGLDIPTVDRVIFYEPIPSAIRTIQRRGRTGRHAKGEVIVLCAKNTRDVASRFIAQRKEKNMYAILDDFKVKKPSQEVTLDSFDQEQPEFRLLVDSREKQSGVLRDLHGKVQLDFAQLQIGDYQVSPEVVIEYKKVDDFVGSLLDGRMLEQVKQLKSHVRRPLIIVEGESVFSARNVHPNAIYGLLTTIMVSFGVPILFTKDGQETAQVLYLLAKREGSTKKQQGLIKKAQTVQEQQLFVLVSCPGVGMGSAKKLLEYFGSLHAIVTADAAELQNVEGIGAQTATQLFLFFREKFR